MSRFNKKETIRFGGKSAQDFGIIDNAPKSKNAFYDIEVEKIIESDKQVHLFLKVKDYEDKEFKKEPIVSKATLSRKEAAIVGWCYVTLIDEDKTARQKSRDYLEKAIENDGGDGFIGNEEIKSALPYYLLSKNNLYENEGSILQMLYRASRCSDVFHDFYWELFRHEKDNLRRTAIAQKALREFPKGDNEYFIDFIVSDLFKKRKLGEARKFFEEQLERISKKEWASGYHHLKVTVVNLLIAQKDFPRAEKILGTIIFNNSTDGLLKGKFFFKKGDCSKAIRYLEEAISSSTKDDDDTQASYYYLLACYAKTKNIPEIQDIIENAKLCHQEFTVFYPLEFTYGDFAERTLKEILKLKTDELLKAKVKGLLVYIQVSTLPVSEDEKPIRVLTHSETKTLKEAEKTIQEVLKYYPNDRAFNAIFSNILYYKKEFDNSLTYKLRAIKGTESSQIFYSLEEVKMSDASDTFLGGYADIVKDAVKNYGVSIQDYIEHQFNEDVGALYEKKKYRSIKELYEYVKPHINNLATLGKNNYYGTWHVGLFELGYALRECDDNKGAKEVYEAYLESHPDASSALNNLAIIYEKEKNLKKAKTLIKRAKENTKGDEIIERNYNRIFSAESSVKMASQPKQQLQEEKKDDEKISRTLTEKGVGYLLLDGGKFEVCPDKNVPFKLLEALSPFGVPKATNAIFNTSSTERSKFKSEQLTLGQKQDILRTRIKDLQEILRKKKIKVTLVFNNHDETVFLKQN